MAEAPAKGSLGELPDGGLARVQDALARAWTYLDDEARVKLAALQDKDTLQALAVILIVWGGFQVTPFAWAVDAILVAVGALAGLADVAELLGGVVDSVLAKTPEEFDAASRRIAKGIAGIGIDVVAMLIGGTLLATVRRGIRWAKGTKTGAKILARVPGDPVLESPTPPAKPGGMEAPKVPAKPGFATSIAADVAIGAAVGVGAVNAAPVVSQTWNDTKNALNIGLPIVGGLVLVVGIWAVSSAGKDRRR